MRTQQHTCQKWHTHSNKSEEIALFILIKRKPAKIAARTQQQCCSLGAIHPNGMFELPEFKAESVHALTRNTNDYDYDNDVASRLNHFHLWRNSRARRTQQDQTISASFDYSKTLLLFFLLHTYLRVHEQLLYCSHNRGLNTESNFC